MLTGSARERNIGTVRYAGVVRSGRKWRNSIRTKKEMTAKASRAKASEPIEDLILGEVSSRSAKANPTY